MNHKIKIGVSGWTYEGWRSSFYPDGLKSREELAFASKVFSSIEVNGTFHNLFKPQHFQNWYEQTPDDFVFAIKGPKYITHQRRLKDFETPLSNFLASGILALGAKLGPILWQFPPTLPFSRERFEPFFKALPQSTKQAAHLGSGHSTWLEGRSFLNPLKDLPMRHAVEGRHMSFRSQEFIELAAQYGIAVVFGDTAGRWPYMEDVTSDFVYIRLHGDEEKYPDGYTESSLVQWADRCQIWAGGGQPHDADLVWRRKVEETPRQVFAFFDNDVKELAPVNAQSLQSALGQTRVLGSVLAALRPAANVSGPKKDLSPKPKATKKKVGKAAASKPAPKKKVKPKKSA